MEKEKENNYSPKRNKSLHHTKKKKRLNSLKYKNKKMIKPTQNQYVSNHLLKTYEAD